MTGIELRQHLARLGWTQVELARRTGYAQESVSRWVCKNQRVPGAIVAYVKLNLRINRLSGKIDLWLAYFEGD